MVQTVVRAAWVAGFLLLALVVVAAAFAGWRLTKNGYVGVATRFADSPLRKNPPPRLTAPVTLKLATFNIQALWVAGKNRPARMRAIAEYLAPLDPDVIGFQECFVSADRELLLSELGRQTRLLHHEYYPSGNVGSGLLICSAYPICEAWFHRYQAIAPAWKFWQGDGLAGKGIGLARIALPGAAGFLDFFNTHAQAGYGNDAYKVLRKEEMAEAAEFINAARCGPAPAFVTGDFNARRGAPEHDLLVARAGLDRVMSVESTIDHIYAARDPHYHYEVIETREIPATIEKDGRPFELSDHNGYLTTVRISPVG